MDRTAVRKKERLVRPQMRRDFSLVDCRHFCVRQRQKNQVGTFDRPRRSR